MSSVFFSAKGGNCTTVTAAAHAIVAAAARGPARPIVIVDLGGDMPAVLATAETETPGINDWLSESCRQSADDLVASAVPVAPGLVLVHRGASFVEGRPRWGDLATLLGTHDVVLDAGTGWFPPEVAAAARETVLVTRPCYISLRRAVRLPTPTRVMALCEPGRALTVDDIGHVLGTSPVRVPWDTSISRAVDAGLLAQRAAQLFGEAFAASGTGSM